MALLVIIAPAFMPAFNPQGLRSLKVATSAGAKPTTIEPCFPKPTLDRKKIIFHLISIGGGVPLPHLWLVSRYSIAPKPPQ